ncbi:MAG: NAD(P)-dependent alcohol dehydrogenase [Bryobacteraceae bacterium]|nr:NAD(P)-dependent alcohol dehydrogenase [Bryobacteraceae bacterium]
MKAYVIPQFGIDSLEIVDRPDPVAAPGEAVIEMKAWSLNYRDTLVIEGEYNPKMKLPMVPFSDGAGEVIAVGEGVTRVKPGDRVCPIFMQGWIGGAYRDEFGKTALGGAIEGVLAEKVALKTDGLVKIPAGYRWEEAATLPCAAVTAWDAVVEQGRVKAGDTILVLGSGGVSVFALQFARMHGATVIATSSSAAKAERLKSMGAAEVIDYNATPDWHKEILKRFGGVDHVVEVGGAGTFSKSLMAARGGGRVSVIGNLTGLTTDVNVALILHKFLSVQGIFVGSRDMFESMNRAIEASAMKPVMDRVFEFGEVREALKHMQSAAHFGKIAVRR